jgi:hypothetical protein
MPRGDIWAVIVLARKTDEISRERFHREKERKKGRKRERERERESVSTATREERSRSYRSIASGNSRTPNE